MFGKIDTGPLQSGETFLRPKTMYFDGGRVRSRQAHFEIDIADNTNSTSQREVDNQLHLFETTIC